MIGCPGTHIHWVHLEKPEMLESAALRTCMVMSLIPLRNVLKRWLNECSVKNTHTVCDCSPLTVLRARHVVILLLPSPPSFLFAFAPVFVTGWFWFSAYIQIAVSASFWCCVNKKCDFFFSSTVLVAEYITRDCHRHNPACPHCGDQESHQAYKTISRVIILPKFRLPF